MKRISAQAMLMLMVAVLAVLTMQVYAQAAECKCQHYLWMGITLIVLGFVTVFLLMVMVVTLYFLKNKHDETKMLRKEMKQMKALKSTEAHIGVEEKDVKVDIDVLDKVVRGKFCQLTLQVGQVLHDQKNKAQLDTILNEVHDTVEALKDTSTADDMLYEKDEKDNATNADNPIQQLVSAVRAATEPNTVHKKLYLLYKKLYHDAENVGVSLNVLANSYILTRAAVDTCSIAEIQKFIDDIEKEENIELLHEFATNLEEAMEEEEYKQLNIPDLKREDVDETDEVLTVDQHDANEDNQEEEEAMEEETTQKPNEPLNDEN